MWLLSPLLPVLPLLLAPDAGKLEEQANLRLEILHLLDVPLHPRLDQFRLLVRTNAVQYSNILSAAANSISVASPRRNRRRSRRPRVAVALLQCYLHLLEPT